MTPYQTCEFQLPDKRKCSQTEFDHLHQPAESCTNGAGKRHHEYVPPKPHEHLFDRCMCGEREPA